MGALQDYGFPFTSKGGDRQYNSDTWREFFKALVTGGIVGDIDNELEILPQDNPNKTVKIDTGAVIIEGALKTLESQSSLQLSDNTSGSTRIDRIVARLNLTDRKIEFAVLEGTPGAGAPALTQTSSIYELSLAQVELANGYSTITASEITDERSDESLCGYFKYRAKPAWYPGGDVPVDAWMYVLFKDQLTAQEIAEIEGNSSLMAIINNAKAIIQATLSTDGTLVSNSDDNVPTEKAINTLRTKSEGGVTLTDSIAAGNTLTKNIALPHGNFKQGMLIVRPYNSGAVAEEGAVIFFSTISGNTKAIATTYNSYEKSMSAIKRSIEGFLLNKGSDTSGFGVHCLVDGTGDDIRLDECYINGSNIQLEFTNETVDKLLSLDTRIDWEVW